MPYLTIISQQNSNEYINHQENNTWEFEDSIEAIKTGELFLFVQGLQYNGEGDAPPGFPLLNSYEDVPILINEIRRAEVREIHPDGRFEVSYKEADMGIEGKDLDPDILEKIRLCITGKEYIEIDLAKFFKFTK